MALPNIADLLARYDPATANRIYYAAVALQKEQAAGSTPTQQAQAVVQAATSSVSGSDLVRQLNQVGTVRSGPSPTEQAQAVALVSAMQQAQAAGQPAPGTLTQQAQAVSLVQAMSQLQSQGVPTTGGSVADQVFSAGYLQQVYQQNLFALSTSLSKGISSFSSQVQTPAGGTTSTTTGGQSPTEYLAALADQIIKMFQQGGSAEVAVSPDAQGITVTQAAKTSQWLWMAGIAGAGLLLFSMLKR